MNFSSMNNKCSFSLLFEITFWTTVVEELINAFDLPRIEHFNFVIDFHPAMKNRIKLCSEQKYLVLIIDLYTVTTHCHDYTTKRSVSARLGQRGRRGASTNDVTGGNNSYALIGEP